MATETIKFTNDIFPSKDDESCSVTMKRSELEKEYADFESEMMVLEDLMTKMKHRRYSLLEKLNDTSPWSTIVPLDVTTEIFSLVCESHDEANSGELPMQFILGQICRAWRRVVWSTPRLWSTLKIRFTQAKFPRQEKLIKQWILRSGNHPLHVYLDVVVAPKWEPTEAFFDFLLESSSRWKSLDTFVFRGLAQAIQKRGDKDPFPCLQKVVLHDGRRKAAPYITNPIFNFKTNSIRIFRDQVNVMRYSYSLNFATLKELEITLDPDLCLPLFSLLREVQTLKLRLVAGRLGWKSPAKPPYLVPRLQHLTIEALPAHVSYCLDAVKAPNLVSLVADMTSVNPDTNWLRSIADLQIRSACRLTSLSIKNGYVASEDEANSILDSLHTLECLSLDSVRNFSLSDLTIGLLNPGNRTTRTKPFLPNLTNLKFKGFIEFIPMSLILLLKERLLFSQTTSSDDASSVKALRNVDIIYWNREWGHSDGSDPNVLRDFHQRMTSLPSLGLSLNITWENLKRSRGPYLWN